MWFFKKKRVADLLKEDRELVNYNCDTVDVLLELANGKDELVADLKKLKDDLHYLTPSQLDEVYKYDQKIKNALSELKVLIPGKDENKVAAGLTDVRVLIAERNRNLK